MSFIVPLYRFRGEKKTHKSNKVNGVCLLSLCVCCFCSGMHSPSQSYRTSWWYWTKKKRTKFSKCKGSTRSSNRDCNRPWKKPEASLDNPSGGTGHQTKLDIIFKMKRHFSGHLIVVTLPLHPSIKDRLSAPIKWPYSHFLLLKPLIPGPEPVKEREACFKTAAVNKPNPAPGSLSSRAIRRSSFAEDARCQTQQEHLLADASSRATLAARAPPSNPLALARRCCGSRRVPTWPRSRFVSRAQEAADKAEEVVAPNHVGVAAAASAGRTCWGLRQPGKCQVVTPRQLQHPNSLLASVTETC